MSSLQEQLLKAGLTTKQKARQANSDKRKKQKQKRSGANVEQSMQEQVKQELAKSKADKLAKDAALNAEKQQQLANKEAHQRKLQILEHHSLKDIDGDKEYNYNFEGKIKKLALDEQTYQALVNGRLAVCGLAGVSYVVTAETAAKLQTLDNDIVLVQNDKQETAVDEEDPYADYQIPDDLMW
ncbi:DUF2058 domain-containing protein [Thalassotalea agarivorans]|uniref:Nucleoprotein/polynucleotide-associated enzyme n=1 Tax=Thalassotalea agarivorans TaxID=349064 RepID=A0A1H9ZI58_THASX|nr:DUF2058 domain-containing protein [Thalassotalea agarivorans]SES80754.1 hypothetical protein SAMN05660429_00443 [Thalassotalea agarivorans]